MKMEIPCPEWMLSKVWEWMKEFDQFMVDDACPKSLEQLAEKHSRDLGNGAIECAFVSDEGQALGIVWAEKANEAFYFGHLVFDRSLTPSQKFEYTQRALRLMFDSGVKRIVWLSLDSNRPFKIFLRKLRAQKGALIDAGATRNGVPFPVQIYYHEGIQ